MPLRLLYQLFNQTYDCADELDENRNQDDDFARVVLIAVFLFPAHWLFLLCVVYLS